MRLKRETFPHTDSIPLDHIARFLPDNPVVVEAGAHDGTDTFRIALRFAGGIVHAFEPVPDQFHALQTKFRWIRNVRCYPFALSDQNGEKELFCSGGQNEASSSLLPPKTLLDRHPDIVFSRGLVVPTVTLDAWANIHKVNNVDFLWLDMQGGELAALQASPVTVANVKAVHTEVFLTELYEGAPLYPQVCAWMSANGFEVDVEEFPWDDAGNVLFVKR